jgi:glycerate-2-kinase
VANPARAARQSNPHNKKPQTFLPGAPATLITRGGGSGGRNIRLKLARDLEAPVARAKVSDLREARWI